MTAHRLTHVFHGLSAPPSPNTTEKPLHLETIPEDVDPDNISNPLDDYTDKNDVDDTIQNLELTHTATPQVNTVYEDNDSDQDSDNNQESDDDYDDDAYLTYDFTEPLV
jgi:hypothetical protein